MKINSTLSAACYFGHILFFPFRDVKWKTHESKSHCTKQIAKDKIFFFSVHWQQFACKCKVPNTLKHIIISVCANKKEPQ